MPISRSGRLLIAALAVAGTFAPAQPARADNTILNFLLPWIFGEPELGPQPQDTLQAPFGQEKIQVTSKTQAEMQKIFEAEDATELNLNELNLPHRSPEQIGDWLTTIVTQAMSIEPDTYAEKSKSFLPNFLPYAQQEYQTYLSSNQVLETLRTNNMKVNAFAEGRPSLIQEGVLDGTYRWLFRVPVMLTYYDRSTTTLKGRDHGKAASQQTQRVLINIQVGRVPVSQNIESMIIERWSVTRAR